MRKRSDAVIVPRTLAWIALIGLMTACAANDGAGRSNAGMNKMNNAQGYSDDGYLGITSSYPHIPGRHMALNYANDARLMRDAIRDLPGVAGADITFNGAEAFVTLRIEKDWEARRIPTVEREAAAVLRFNFPRYTIHVTSIR